MSAAAVAGRVFVDGIAVWTPSLPGWAEARAAFRGEAVPATPIARRPPADILAPAERRRAPDTVALALEVAAAAVRASGRAADTLPSIFTSAHGDLAVNDYMCKTLASEPTLISPTKFHNSVHNAAAGYWTIATGCRAASTALTAYEASFGAGLLEAAAQCRADEESVLLVAFDVEATGALASVTRSEGLFACAFVLSPQRSARSVAAFDWSLASGPVQAPPLRSGAAQALGGNAMSGALPLLEALATSDGGRESARLDLPLSRRLALALDAVALPIQAEATAT